MNEEFNMIINGQICPYCRCNTELVNGDFIYPHRLIENPRPKFLDKKYYVCIKDSTHYVGTYSDNITSLGRIANSELRKLKSKGHQVFDPLWKQKIKFNSQKQAYEWLSEKMNLPQEFTHFGMFTNDECIKAINICEKQY
jgi:hypothetical protein